MRKKLLHKLDFTSFVLSMAADRPSLPLGIYRKGLDLSQVAVLTGFPADLDTIGVADFISSEFKLQTKAAYFHGNNQEVALVLLNQSIGNARTLGHAQLIPLSPAKGVVVDIPDGADITMLQAYFESDRSGVNGEYSRLELTSGALLIQIPDAHTVLPNVLNKKHKLRETELFIEPYYPVFHDLVFKLGAATSPTAIPQQDSDSSDGGNIDKRQELTLGQSQTKSDSDKPKTLTQSWEATQQFPDSFDSCKNFNSNSCEKKKEENDEVKFPRSSCHTYQKHRTNIGNVCNNQTYSSDDHRDCIKVDISCSEQERRNNENDCFGCQVDTVQDSHRVQGSDTVQGSDLTSDENKVNPSQSMLLSDRNNVSTKRKNGHFPNVRDDDNRKVTLNINASYDTEESSVLTYHLQSSTGQDFVHKFQTQNKCRLNVEYAKVADTSTASLQRTYQDKRSNASPKEPHQRKCIPRGAKQSKSINGTDLSIRLGDISKEKADVIVNVIGPSRNFDESMISKNIMKAGGPVYIQEILNVSYSDPIIRTIGGNLQCHEVFTLVVDVWQNAQSEEVLSTLVADCFKLCCKHGFKTISVPVIGVGRLLKYPFDVAVATMFKEAVNATTKCSLKAITIVAFEDKAYLALADLLKKENLSTTPNGAATSTEHDTGEKDEKPKQNTSRITECAITISSAVYSPESLRIAVIEDLRDHFLHQETAMIPVHSGLPLRLKGRLYEIINGSENVACIKIDPLSGAIDLKGERDHVIKSKSNVEKFMAGSDFHLGNPLKCGAMFWSNLAHEYPQTPSYWTQFPKCKQLTDVLRSTPSSKRMEIVPVDSKTDEAVRELVKGTWQKDLVGQGRDAVNLSHTSLKIKKVERIENLELFVKYAMKRQELFRKLADQNVKSFPKISDLPVQNKGNPITEKKMRKPLNEEIFPEINECLVFHGTKPNVMDTVIHQGLDYRLSSDNAMFGMGIYGAESSTKADQYVDSKQNRTSGPKKMLILRMLLGKSFICSDSNPKKYRRPPCTYPRCRKDDCIDIHERFDSVVGDGPWLFREFVVYATDQCYPEYLITYERK